MGKYIALPAPMANTQRQFDSVDQAVAAIGDRVERDRTPFVIAELVTHVAPSPVPRVVVTNLNSEETGHVES